MSSWLATPDGSWSTSGDAHHARDGGVGPYELSHLTAVDEVMLNGRVSAEVRLLKLSSVSAVGLACRVAGTHSLVAAFVISSPEHPGLFTLRMGALKRGAWTSLVELREPFAVDHGRFAMALQFFSGSIIAELRTGATERALAAVIPEVPFPGGVGAIRFYGTTATVSKLTVERITMEPKLSREEEGRASDEPFLHDVFISYASADLPLVTAMEGRLLDAGISYWVDHDQITFGDPIVHKIEQGLENSRLVLVCISSHLKASGWCRAEYGPILHREFSGDTTRRVIPVLLDGSDASTSVPLLLSDKMRADFRDEQSFGRLLEFIKGADSASS